MEDVSARLSPVALDAIIAKVIFAVTGSLKVDRLKTIICTDLPDQYLIFC